MQFVPGTVTFASWGAGGGYTIVVENDDIKVSYCSRFSNFIISKYDTVVAGQIIANVGPKNGVWHYKQSIQGFFRKTN